MKKVISFSLWGDNPTYNIGAIENVKQAEIFYPDFECWIYIHHDSVPKETIDILQKMKKTRVILKTGDLNIIRPMMWRFEAIDNPEVEIMMSRDTDTRILDREVLAVNEWLKSDKLFHIMRDHPHHNFCILGGMFGTRKIPNIVSWINIMNSFKQIGKRDYDQTFLKDYIYPIIKNNSIIHASFHKYEPHSKNFPIYYDNEYRFVGEYIYHDNTRSEYHINELKRYLR